MKQFSDPFGPPTDIMFICDMVMNKKEIGKLDIEIDKKNNSIKIKLIDPDWEIGYLKYYVNEKYMGATRREQDFRVAIPSCRKFSLSAKVFNRRGRFMGEIHGDTFLGEDTNQLPYRRTGIANEKHYLITSQLDEYTSYENYYVPVDKDCEKIKVFLKASGVDYDLYGAFNRLPTYFNYDWISYNVGDEEFEVTNLQEGKMFIRVEQYQGSGTYDLKVIQYLKSPEEDKESEDKWNGKGKYAIIVGISDYERIGDLNYCDEDATDWYQYLTEKGYQCKIYGDPHVTNYPRYDGLATEDTVRKEFRELLQFAGKKDKVVFVTSGHGSGDKKGKSFLCMYHCGKGSAGQYWDYEMEQDIKSSKNKPQIAVVIDHCFSGGIADNLKNCPNTICMTTCTENGYGWDQSKVQNGAWTFCFLHYTLQNKFQNKDVSLQEAFEFAHNAYPKITGNTAKGDQPMMTTSFTDPVYF